jgi:hypothetical protein
MGQNMNIEAAPKEAMTIDGALGASLVDWESGMSLGAAGGGKYLDLDVARAQGASRACSSPPAITEPEMITTTMPAYRRGHRP